MIYLIAMLLLFSSCAPMQFTNAGSKNTLKQDQYDCRVELGIYGNAGVGSTSQRLADVAFVRGEMTECMERKGWKRTS